MAEICITSQVTAKHARVLATEATFGKASGSKCTRCWKVLPEVGQNKNHEELCNRCDDAVDHIEKNRKAA